MSITTVIGPFSISKWLTLKKLKQSIDNKSTPPKRLEVEKFLFKSYVKEVA